ncbi:uncharacterized protein [Drosophila tropicalis]|uniref:uncharacterized protein n=1 Tax=Drosophila tropicalis TaxID=46794 RepID=UPI0035AC26C4
MDDINSNPCNQKNDLCYTEDHIVVQELYLYAIPTELKEEELLEYFNSYGKVGHLHLSANDRCCPGKTDSDSSGRLESHQQEKEVKTGRVLFVSPLDAAKLLLNKIHHVNGRQFQVTVTHSWLQPEGIDILEPPSSQPEQSHVMKVPDDCLVRILELLPLTDQLRFLRYCSRFRDILHLDTRTSHKSVDFGCRRSEWDIRDLFLIFGPSIERIRYDASWVKIPFERFLDYFKPNCAKFKSFTLLVTKLTSGNMLKMFDGIDNLEDLDIFRCNLHNDCLLSLKNIRKLKKLCVRDCYQINGDVESSQLTDDNLAILQDLKELKILNLSSNHNVKGDLKLPSSIETMCLSECKKVTPNNLIQMCKSLPNLKELDISDIRNVPTEIYDYLNSIETFTFDIGYPFTQYKKVARLPNLKRIQNASMSGGNGLKNLLDELADIKSQQLEHFGISELMEVRQPTLLQMAKLTGLRKLYFYSEDAMDNNVLEEFTKLKQLESLCSIPFDEVDDNGILLLINGCPKLRHLSLSNCSELTESLVLAIIDNVRRQIINKENQRELPIYLFVQDTKIRKSIEAHPDVAAKNIIKLVFDCCDCFFG